MIAHNGHGFDSFVVLNNLLQWRSVVNSIKNGTGVFSPKIFNGYVDEKENTPQFVHFRWGRFLISSRLKKLGISYEFQPSLP